MWISMNDMWRAQHACQDAFCMIAAGAWSNQQLAHARGEQIPLDTDARVVSSLRRRRACCMLTGIMFLVWRGETLRTGLALSAPMNKQHFGVTYGRRNLLVCRQSSVLGLSMHMRRMLFVNISSPHSRLVYMQCISCCLVSASLFARNIRFGPQFISRIVA